LDLIKDLFKRTNLFHAEIESRMETQMELVDKELVPGTFSWTEDDSTYQAWESGRKDPYLFILGNTGSGKTFFACHCYKSIQQRSVKTMATSEDSSERKRAPLVTYFPFKIGREESQNLGSVLAYTIFQIARQNTKLCDSIARDLQVSKEFERGKDVDSEARLKFLWQNLLVDKFEKATEASKELFILLDGVEVMSEPDRKMMLDLFQDLSTEKCVVRVLMTATENALIFKKGFGLPGCPKIALDEKIRNEKDIQKIMGFRINKSERLKSFKPKVWEKVEDKLLESPNRKAFLHI
jgi:Cdc6-like AAA superfamily ATPase